MRRGLLLPLLVVTARFAFVGEALGATITNGGFETGDFTGWTTADQSGGSGSWFVYSETSLPSESCTNPGTAPQSPPQGTYAATTDQSGPGSHVLYQDITLEAGAKHTLSFELYYNSVGAFASPATLDYTVTPNQQYRVDVMRPTASPFSVAPSDILEALYQTTTSSPGTLAPTTMTFDLSAFAGQTVLLRFAEADNQGCFLAGVDNVQIASTPSVQTGAATNVTDSGATLNGTVDPDGQATTYHFDYGTSPNYGQQVPASDASVGSDSTSHSESQALSGLLPNTTYHFRIVATNASGTTDGADQTFTTAAAPVVTKVAAPGVTTEAASDIFARAATLNGVVNPENAATTYYFEYGTSAYYGHRAPASAASVGSDATGHSESQHVSGLKPHTTYHFRIVATNSSGTTYGPDQKFTTASAKLSLSVAPGSAEAGTLACFKFKAASNGQPVAGVTVQFAGRKARTSSKGTATVCATLADGTYRPTATRKGFTRVHATVDIFTPRFTG